VEEETVPSLRRGGNAVLPYRLALVQAGGCASELTLDVGRQTGKGGFGVAAIGAEARGARRGDTACSDGGGGDASGQSDGSDEGDNGFLEEHC
jgi:hypothetical protein